MPKRQLSVYEKNHLNRFGIDPEAIDQYGEMPVEYIAGKALFLGQEFKVTSETLIPRVETEELVEFIKKDFSNEDWQGKTIAAVDVGTGCGVIGLSMALFFEKLQLQYQLTLTDISSDALKVAQENLQALLPELKRGQVEFLLSDLLTSFPTGQSLDFIFANVPYVPRERIFTLESSVKDFEPLMALDGGEDGLRYVFLLLDQAKKILKPGGKIYLELDDTHTAEKFQKFSESYEYSLAKDQFGKNRFGIFTLKNQL